MKATKEIFCDSALDFLRLVNPFEGEFQSGFVFRGQSNASWHLVPSLLRTKPLEDKIAALKPGVRRSSLLASSKDNIEHDYDPVLIFERAARGRGHQFTSLEIFGDDNSRWFGYSPDLAALAQHYEVETKLLDWTESMHVAAYFAVSDNIRQQELGISEDFAIWGAKDTERAMGSTSKWTGAPNRANLRWRFFRPANPLNVNIIAQRGKLMDAVLTDSGSNLATESRWPNSVDELAEEIFNSFLEEDDRFLDPRPFFWKFVLPYEEATELLSLLERVNISGSTVFPGLTGIARETSDSLRYFKLLELRELLKFQAEVPVVNNPTI